MNNTSTTSIRIVNLTREYAPGRGVTGITLDIEPGECFAVLGRNGSGKSTLTRLLLGLERPDSGNITVLGNNSVYRSKDHLSNTGATLDTSIHWDRLSGWDNAFFVARNYRMPVKEIEHRLYNLFELADLTANAFDPVHTYSFGMRRKLSIIEALCHDPELLVLDEPTTGVDVQFQIKLSRLIKERTVKGFTTWISGNDPDWIAGVASRIAFMEFGKFIAAGTVDELIGEVAQFQEICVTINPPLEIPKPCNVDCSSYMQTGNSITILVDKNPGLVPEMMDWIVSQGGKINKVEVRQSTLSDAFLLKTGRALEE
ncbi:MAG: ABC transporter ATP-binding protein [Candidatus Latescibacteria bacterium]|nr:ABC transporter ATP-binding protein [Candidatus Latescibacterota bacterium]